MAFPGALVVLARMLADVSRVVWGDLLNGWGAGKKGYETFF